LICRLFRFHFAPLNFHIFRFVWFGFTNIYEAVYKMAAIRKIGTVWQAQIARLRIRKSATFPTKIEAQQ
jgi:hypothetical protein